IDGGDVLIRGGKIAAVGKGLANPGVREVDAAGRWVTPGVIDVHSHDGTFVLPLTSIDREASDVSEVASPNSADTWLEKIGRAHVCTPVTNAHIVCRLLL